MSDRPSKSGPWPLLAITVLVLLLSAFLVVRFRKQDEVPPVVKEIPVSIPVAVAPAPPPPPAPVPAPAGVTPADGKELEALLETAVRALEAKRWKEAEEALGKAAKLSSGSAGPLQARLQAGRKAEEDAKLAEEAALEKKRIREQAFALVRLEVEKASSENRWDAATALLAKLAAEHPEIERDAEYRREVERTTSFRSESDAVFTQAMADAERLFREGKYAQASSAAEKSLISYPERRSRVDVFQKRVREAKIEAEMVRIPSALCWIGSEEQPDERPRRQVKLPSFYIDRTAVSNEDYQAFVLSTGHAAPPAWQGKTPPKGRERHPVVYVTWEDARAYAGWAGKRLPTAEEWEVAARGPDGREYPWGSAFTEKENVFHANSLEYWQVNKTLAPGTTPVDASLGANGESAFRVYGMGGNVWAWTLTPVRKGEGGPEYRILKGGSFMTSGKALRCANVLLEDPRLAHPDVGFRCARDAK